MIAAIWSLITGTMASTKRVSVATTARITERTAYVRFIPRRTKNSTIGLSPAARNIATTTRTSTELIFSSWLPSQNASRAPSPAKKPM